MGVVLKPGTGHPLRCACDAAQFCIDGRGAGLACAGDWGEHGVFSLLDAVMLRSLPVKEPAQLVLLEDGTWNGISDGFPITELYSYPFCREMQSRNAVFSDVTAIMSMMNGIHGSVEGTTEQSRSMCSLFRAPTSPRWVCLR
jgi:hypothetical protein